MLSLIALILMILNLMSYLIIGTVILSWLIAFGIVNGHSPIVSSFMNMLDRLTAPLLDLIRRWIPAIEGLDISPVIALIGLWFLGNLINEYAYPAAAAMALR
jgi:YggT family protein